ncbi:MAG: hypothetical protein KKG59_01015 [Nanoarchaeota archaeon]|nr:hypothetical protein [Nanoarchaeota archaeon]
MCWSFAASIVFTTIGLLISIYLIWKKDDPHLWVSLIYFSLMELLQVFTYVYLNQCDLPINQMLTYIGYLHIAFQPFFMNMIMMHFIPTKVRAKISGYVYAICFISAILMLIRAYPFVWAESCKTGGMLCGAKLCSISGNWHLAWSIPQNNFGLIFNMVYPFSVFVLPLIYGSWKINIYQIIIGPVLALLLTTNSNEFPAVWCLFSVAIFLVVLIPRLRKKMYVKKWYFWNYPKKLSS